MPCPCCPAPLTQVPTQHSTDLAMGWCFPASPKVPTLVGTRAVKGKANRDEERGENRWQRTRHSVSGGGGSTGAAPRGCSRHRSQNGSPAPALTNRMSPRVLSWLHHLEDPPVHPIAVSACPPSSQHHQICLSRPLPGSPRLWLSQAGGIPDKQVMLAPSTAGDSDR